MANLMPLIEEIDRFKAGFSELVRRYSNELRAELEREIHKEKKERENQKLREFEKIQLSKANASRFLKILQIIEDLKEERNLGDGKIPIIANKYGISKEEAEILLNMIRYARLYHKFADAKTEIYRFL